MRVTIDLDENTFAAKEGEDVIIFQSKGDRVSSVRLTVEGLNKIIQPPSLPVKERQ